MACYFRLVQLDIRSLLFALHRDLNKTHNTILSGDNIFSEIHIERVAKATLGNIKKAFSEVDYPFVHNQIFKSIEWIIFD